MTKKTGFDTLKMEDIRNSLRAVRSPEPDERGSLMETKQPGKRIWKVLGFAALGALCLWIVAQLLISAAARRDLDKLTANMRQDFYSEAEQLRYLSKPDDLDEERLKQAEHSLVRMGFDLELYWETFSTAFGEELSQKEVSALNQYFDHLAGRVGAARVRGTLSPEDRQAFADGWWGVNEMLGTQQPFRYLYDYIQRMDLDG